MDLFNELFRKVVNSSNVTNDARQAGKTLLVMTNHCKAKQEGSAHSYEARHLLH